jgi:hypothetical protein
MKFKIGALCILVTSVLITLTISVSAVAAPGPGANLLAGNVSAFPGETGVAVAIDLASDAAVSVAAISFDMNFDHSRLTFKHASVGDAALAAGKQVASSIIADGTVRVIIYGLNQTAIGDGRVVFLVFDVDGNASPGVIPFTFSNAAAAAPDATPVTLTGTDGSIMLESTTFVDVPRDHWAYDYIEILYQGGYVAGCSADPLMYCPDNTMTRGESAVFVERGIHGAGYLPPNPTQAIFTDVPLWEWFAKWATRLWNDGYTAGCGTDPLVYCPLQEHTRTEGTVFFLRMMNGAGYVPPDPSGIFADVSIDFWGAKWIEAAYNAGLITACETSPQLKFCPDDPLDRAMAAYMMVQAKGLNVP